MDKQNKMMTRRMSLALIALGGSTSIVSLAKAQTQTPFMRLDISGQGSASAPPSGGGGGGNGGGGNNGSATITIVDLVINGCSVTARAVSSVPGTVFTLVNPPPGLTIDPNTGIISGTLTNCGAFTLQASGTTGTEVVTSPPVSGVASAPSNTLTVVVDQYQGITDVGSFYGMIVQASGGTGPYAISYENVQGNLASMMAVSYLPLVDDDTGFVVDGQFAFTGPTIGPGTAQIRIRATDANGNVGLSNVLTITFVIPGPGPVVQ